MARKTYKERCLVLRKTKLGEADSIITLLARDGRQIRAVAKGVRKPASRFGARLELCSVVDVLLYPGRSLDVVSEVRCVSTNDACRIGLEKAGAAEVICEFLEKLTRDGAATGDRVFALTEVAFAAIGRGTELQAGMFAAAHLLKAMAMQGLRPAIHECALCGAPLDKVGFFDISMGGALCADCAGVAASSPVDVAIVPWIDLMLRSTFDELSRVEQAPVRKLLDVGESWMREHLSLNLKSIPFLKSLY